jgi:hypothetical protein
MVLRSASRPRPAESDPGVDPSGVLEVISAGGEMYCLEYVNWDIDTDETWCTYTPCALV